MKAEEVEEEEEEEEEEEDEEEGEQSLVSRVAVTPSGSWFGHPMFISEQIVDRFYQIGSWQIITTFKKRNGASQNQ